MLLSYGYQYYTSGITTLNKVDETNIDHTSRYFDKDLLMEPELAKEAIKQIAKCYKIEKTSAITLLISMKSSLIGKFQLSYVRYMLHIAL